VIYTRLVSSRFAVSALVPADWARPEREAPIAEIRRSTPSPGWSRRLMGMSSGASMTARCPSAARPTALDGRSPRWRALVMKTRRSSPALSAPQPRWTMAVVEFDIVVKAHSCSAASS